MKSDQYKGWKETAKQAERLGGTVDKPELVGQDWWTTVRLPGLDPYTGDVREVNSFVQGFALGHALASPPVTTREDGHDFQVMCSACLDEPIDVEDIDGPCPEKEPIDEPDVPSGGPA